ncbi:dip2/Utp12 family domain-containing protein [Phthorimaea operculella]|nr:dip2/Utp12 family domain-containing protein [Phthorimaea operculella]
MAETAFSEDGKYFSAISQDGRLRIWDTETNVLKQEYTPDLHLTSPPSCLQWISVRQSAPSQKGARRKSVSEDQETQCIALGTTSGKILIYSVAQAKVETVLEERNNEISRSSITSIDWHKKYGLYSVNKESVVIEWDLQSSNVRNKYNVNVDKSKQANSISAIKIIPHNQKTAAKYLVTASTQIRVWRLHTDAELIKCLGHNASPKALLTVASLNNTCWLVEGSQNERLLSFWDVTITADLVPQINGEESTPNRKKRKKSLSSPVTVSTPTYNFVLEDAPKQIDVDVRTEENGTKLSLAAVTRSGVVHYYGHMLNGASTKPIKPSVTIQVSTADAAPLALQCCRLQGQLLVGYSQGTATVFETIVSTADAAPLALQCCRLQGQLLVGYSQGTATVFETIVSTADAAPLALQCCRLQGQLLVGYSQGTATVFETIVSLEYICRSTVAIQVTVTIQVSTADAAPLALQCCRLQGQLLVGYSQGTATVFETIIPDLKSKTQVLIRGDGKEGKKQKQTKKQNETNKVRGETSSNDVTYVEPMGGVTRKRATPGATVEVPMEERLANLTVDLKKRGAAAVSQNMTKLLMQGLHSKDENLIRSVVQQNKPQVAFHTVAALPAGCVPLLLQHLADMATRRTTHCASVCTWVGAVLRCHSALLLATLSNSSNNHLAHLLAIFTHRRSHLCQLLNLKGRLELTMSQRQDKDDTVQRQAVLEYNDSSSEEEMEVERVQSDDEQSWNDSDSEGAARDSPDVSDST